MSFFTHFKDEIVAILETRLAYLALGALMGSGGNVKALYDLVISLGGF